MHNEKAEQDSGDIEITREMIQVAAEVLLASAFLADTTLRASGLVGLVRQDHRPILDRLPSRIRFAIGTGRGFSISLLQPSVVSSASAAPD
jgi:hypothetical protein